MKVDTSEMRPFIGTKIIRAMPMNRGDYNEYRGWEVPSDEDPSDEGMLVEYLDGGKANHPDHAGYISWSPIGVFSRAYRQVRGMTFGEALEALKSGCKVAREGWNGEGMFVAAMPPLYLQPDQVNDRTKAHIGDDSPLDCQPYFAMWTAKSQWQPGWLASQADMFAEDWYIVEKEG